MQHYVDITQWGIAYGLQGIPLRGWSHWGIGHPQSCIIKLYYNHDEVYNFIALDYLDLFVVSIKLSAARLCLPDVTSLMATMLHKCRPTWQFDGTRIKLQWWQDFSLYPSGSSFVLTHACMDGRMIRMDMHGCIGVGIKLNCISKIFSNLVEMHRLK